MNSFVITCFFPNSLFPIFYKRVFTGSCHFLLIAEQNKAIVARINKEFIEGGKVETVYEIFSPEFINRTAPPGSPQGPEAIIYFFNHFLKPAFPDIRVVIHDQVAEGDKVTTRKSFHATHKGEFMGMPPTNRPVIMDVIDIVRLQDGKYMEHWGILDMPGLMAQINP